MDELERVLAEGDFFELLGQAESEILEAKGSLPDLATASGRFELAKDVSAFANADGGYVVVGAKTARSIDQAVDVIDSLQLLEQSSFPIDQIQGVVNQCVYPRIQGLEVHWLRSAGDQRGLGVIRIPKQHEDRKPYLIAQLVEDGEVMKSFIAGYVRRQGDSNAPMHLQEFQRKLRQGFDGVSQRLAWIEEKMDRLLDAQAPLPASAAFDEELLRRRMADLSETDQ